MSTGRHACDWSLHIYPDGDVAAQGTLAVLGWIALLVTIHGGPAWSKPGGANQPPPPACVIDMGSNTFRRIVASFANGRYVQKNVEKRTLGVGDDLARHGKISDQKLVENRRRAGRLRCRVPQGGCGTGNRRWNVCLPGRTKRVSRRRDCRQAWHRHGDCQREARVRARLPRRISRSGRVRRHRQWQPKHRARVPQRRRAAVFGLQSGISRRVRGVLRCRRVPLRKPCSRIAIGYCPS